MELRVPYCHRFLRCATLRTGYEGGRVDSPFLRLSSIPQSHRCSHRPVGSRPQQKSSPGNDCFRNQEKSRLAIHFSSQTNTALAFGDPRTVQFSHNVISFCVRFCIRFTPRRLGPVPCNGPLERSLTRERAEFFAQSLSTKHKHRLMELQLSRRHRTMGFDFVHRFANAPTSGAP